MDQKPTPDPGWQHQSFGLLIETSSQYLKLLDQYRSNDSGWDKAAAEMAFSRDGRAYFSFLPLVG